MNNVIELTVEDMEDSYKSALAMGIVTSVVKSGSEDQFVDVFVVNNSPEFLGVLQDMGMLTFYKRSELEKHEKLTLLQWEEEKEDPEDYQEYPEDGTFEEKMDWSAQFDWVNETYED